MPIQFNIKDLVEGPASDQLKETVEQVNLHLQEGLIPEEKAGQLIKQARALEILSRYYQLPLENGSAQTLELENRRDEIIRMAKERFTPR